jgi:hypothetical protein
VKVVECVAPQLVDTECHAADSDKTLSIGWCKVVLQFFTQHLPYAASHQAIGVIALRWCVGSQLAVASNHDVVGRGEVYLCGFIRHDPALLILVCD